MAAAQMAYVRVVRLTMWTDFNMSQSCLIEINKEISELRRHLSCVVCCRLLTDPYEPKGPHCGHYVCRLCIRGCKRLVPECPKCRHCCDFKTYQETRIVTLLLLCYKSICLHIMLGPLFPQLEGFKPVPHTDYDVPAVKLPSMSTQDVISEGSHYDDIMYTFLYESDLPFFSSTKTEELESPLKEAAASITAKDQFRKPLNPMYRAQQLPINRAARVVASGSEYVRRHFPINRSSTSTYRTYHIERNSTQPSPAKHIQALVNIKNESLALIQRQAEAISLNAQVAVRRSQAPATQVRPDVITLAQIPNQGGKVDKMVDAQVETKSQATNVNAEDLFCPNLNGKSIGTSNQSTNVNAEDLLEELVSNPEGKSDQILFAQKDNKKKPKEALVEVSIQTDEILEKKDTVAEIPNRKRKSGEILESTETPLRSRKPIIVSYVQVKPPDKPVDVSQPTSSSVEKAKGGKKEEQKLKTSHTLGAEKPTPKTASTTDSEPSSSTSYKSLILVAISNPEESEHPLVLVENENHEMQCFNVFKDDVAIDPAEVGFHRVQLHTKNPKYSAIPKYAYMPFPPQNTMDGSLSSPSPSLSSSSLRQFSED